MIPITLAPGFPIIIPPGGIAMIHIGMTTTAVPDTIVMIHRADVANITMTIVIGEVFMAVVAIMMITTLLVAHHIQELVHLEAPAVEVHLHQDHP
jgi:hypothetical protein